MTLAYELDLGTAKMNHHISNIYVNQKSSCCKVITPTHTQTDAHAHTDAHIPDSSSCFRKLLKAFLFV